MSSKNLGRTFDLKSAYNLDLTPNTLKGPDGQVAFFDVLALPFGATGSVAAPRLSAAVAYIGKVGLMLPWTAYFDFTTLSPAGQKSEMTFFAEGLKLLRLKFAAEGEKGTSFQ